MPSLHAIRVLLQDFSDVCILTLVRISKNYKGMILGHNYKDMTLGVTGYFFHQVEKPEKKKLIQWYSLPYLWLCLLQFQLPKVKHGPKILNRKFQK